MIPCPAIVAGGLTGKQPVNVLVGKPGTKIECKDGTLYIISKSGAWVRGTRKRFDDRVGLSKGAKRRLSKMVRP